MYCSKIERNKMRIYYRSFLPFVSIYYIENSLTLNHLTLDCFILIAYIILILIIAYAIFERDNRNQ